MDSNNSDTAKMEMDEPTISSSVEALPVMSPGSSSVLVNGASSSTPEPQTEPVTKEEALKVALNHLGQGKRFLLVKDVTSAIGSLGESCQILVELNGQLCPDNAEAHFYYGKALLEQSRLDLAVFNDGPAQAGDKADSSEENEDEDNSDEEENENDPKESDDNEAEAEAMDSSEVVNGTIEIEVPAIGEQKKDEDLNAPSPSRVEDNEKPSTSSGANAEKEPEEELTNLELAWEVLEVAKIAYTAQLNHLSKRLEEDGLIEEEKEKAIKSITSITKRLADTHSLLGEVATESENYEQAVEDFKIAIQIISDLEGLDNRDVAQFYFQMGLAFAFWKKFEQAISSFKKSKDIIESRISNLTEKINNKQTAKDLGLEYDDPSVTEEVEVAELKAVIPELEEKIADTIDAERDNKATLEEDIQEKEIMEKSSPVKNPNPPAVNDISHLVKKKKKADDLPAETPAAKRPCNESRSTDNNVEVSSSSNGTSENHSTKGEKLPFFAPILPIRDSVMDLPSKSDMSSDSELKEDQPFYRDGAKYWDGIEATVDGMLGGLGFLSDIDIKNSERFLKTLDKLPEHPEKSYALDCGAGIGRITKNLLSRYFQKVDLVDQDPKFIEQAKQNFTGNAKIGEFYCCGLQKFIPEKSKYDVIWIQWVLSHLTDEDLKTLLKRCSQSLRPKGLLIIKENCTSGTEIEHDSEDSSMTRPFSHFQTLFTQTGMKIVKHVKQKNFPSDLYPVWTFALMSLLPNTTNDNS